MNIGIIVSSKTGNTLCVAKRIKDALAQKDRRAMCGGYIVSCGW